MASFNSEVMQCLGFYTCLLVLKMFFVTLSTVRFRFQKKIFVAKEDVSMGGKVAFDDPDIERVRRAHLNDLENILPFLAIAILYVLTGADLVSARRHFRIFTAARFVHTIVYLLGVPQPARALAWFTGVGATLSMVFQLMSKTAGYA